MKKIILIFLSFVSIAFSVDFESSVEKNGLVRIQSDIGEAAINKALMYKLAKSYDVNIPNLGPMKITVNKIGVDIQGKDMVVLGYDLKFDVDISSVLPEAIRQPLVGEINYVDQITVRADVSELVTTVNFDKTIDALVASLNLGFLETPIKNQLKNIFKPVDICSQKYGEMLTSYVKNAANGKLEQFDMYMKNFNYKVIVGEKDNYVSIYLYAFIASKNQTFSFDGATLSSNKEFSIEKITYVPYIPFGEQKSCNLPSVPTGDDGKPVFPEMIPYKTRVMVESYNLKEACNESKGFINVNLQTKFGGVTSMYYNIGEAK